MKFGSSVLQGRWGIGKGEVFFFFSWQWHHLLILLLWWAVPSNKPRSDITSYLQACVTRGLQETGACYETMGEIQMAHCFFFFQQTCARCVNIDNFSRAQLKAQRRFLCDGEMRKRERSHPSDGIYRKCFPSSSKSVKAEPEIPNFQMSLWVILCSGPNFYLPSNWQAGKFICENMW